MTNNDKAILAQAKEILEREADSVRATMMDFEERSEQLSAARWANELEMAAATITDCCR